MKVSIHKPMNLGTHRALVATRDVYDEPSGMGYALYVYATDRTGREAEICILPAKRYTEDKAIKIKELVKEIWNVGNSGTDEDEYAELDRDSGQEG